MLILGGPMYCRILPWMLFSKSRQALAGLHFMDKKEEETFRKGPDCLLTGFLITHTSIIKLKKKNLKEIFRANAMY